MLRAVFISLLVCDPLRNRHLGCDALKSDGAAQRKANDGKRGADVCNAFTAPDGCGSGRGMIQR